MTVDVGVGIYECSGLTVASDIPLAAPWSAIADPSEADVTVVLGSEVDQPFERPSTDLIAELVVGDYLCYSICRVGDGYVVRLPWIADFHIDADLRRVVCHPVASKQSEVIPIIIPGTITAFLLSMGGHCVLHGSAVDLGGRALAFVGVSGQGKSTMAAVFCADGATLVTDDVLPLEFGEEGTDPVFCLRSGHEIRLREKAASLARHFGDDAVRITTDERLAVAPSPSPFERLPLSAIVLPAPDCIATIPRSGPGGSVRARRRWPSGGASGSRAGRAPTTCAGSSSTSVSIVSAVPVFEVSVPWGPPFADDLASRVLAGLRAERVARPIRRSPRHMRAEVEVLEYFRQLGDLVDQRWTAQGRRAAPLAGIATTALRDPADSGGVDPRRSS